MNMAASTPKLANDFERTAGRIDVLRKRPSPITFRLTCEERCNLMELSKGMAVSAYIRQCLFGKNAAPRKRAVHTPVRDQQELAKVLAMLGASRIANNLNQLAYQANARSLLLDDDTLRKIDEAYTHVCSMRAALISALGLQGDTGKP